MSGDLRDVLPAVAAVLGVGQAQDRLGLGERLPDVRRVVVVLVDGLGYHLLERLAPHAPLLASALSGSTGHLTELASPFPSTTPTSLVTLGTGADPGRHGVLGFTLARPGTDDVLTHITWRDDPPPREWQPLPSWFQRCASAGLDVRVVLPELFVGSGLTDAAYRGARLCPVGRKQDYADRLLAELHAGPGLLYGYTAALDTAAHRYGIASPQWADAAAGVDRLLTRVAEALPVDAGLVVTADHGGLDIDPTSRLDIAHNPLLAAGLRVVAGEPRVRYLHTVPGAADDVLAAWRGELGRRAEVVSRDEAIADGRFGAVTPEYAARIGDVVVTCREPIVVLATDREPPEVARLVGFHGAATPVERAIPLLTVRP